MSDFPEANRFAPEGEQRVAFVDIDETICFYSTDIRRYDLAEPNQANIDKINKLYEEGWRIIYSTARGGVSKIDYHEFTYEQLKGWGCLFHDLCTGVTGEYRKPPYDIIIDDKAMRIEEVGLPSEDLDSGERYPNQINIGNNEIFWKCVCGGDNFQKFDQCDHCKRVRVYILKKQN